jgi:hypothetical protein
MTRAYSRRTCCGLYPRCPKPMDRGGVFILNEDRVKPLSVPSTAAVKSLQKLGLGTGKLANRVL